MKVLPSLLLFFAAGCCCHNPGRPFTATCYQQTPSPCSAGMLDQARWMTPQPCMLVPARLIGEEATAKLISHFQNLRSLQVQQIV